MVKVQRLFAKTNLKIPVLRTDKQKEKLEFGDWINLVFVVKTFILGRCYGK